MIGFICTDYLRAAKLENYNNVQHFLMAERVSSPFVKLLGLPDENMTFMGYLIPSADIAKQFEQLEYLVNFEAYTNKYSDYSQQ